MSTAAETDRGPAPAASLRTEAAVVGGDGAAGAPAYRMFDVVRLQDRVAFLAGPILFEVGEEFLLELRRGDEVARVQARVTRVDRSAKPGVEVDLLGAVPLSMERR